ERAPGSRPAGGAGRCVHRRALVRSRFVVGPPDPPAPRRARRERGGARRLRDRDHQPASRRRDGGRGRLGPGCARGDDGQPGPGLVVPGRLRRRRRLGRVALRPARPDARGAPRAQPRPGLRAARGRGRLAPARPARRPDLRRLRRAEGRRLGRRPEGRPPAGSAAAGRAREVRRGRPHRGPPGARAGGARRPGADGHRDAAHRAGGAGRADARPGARRVPVRGRDVLRRRRDVGQRLPRRRGRHHGVVRPQRGRHPDVPGDRRRRHPVRPPLLGRGLRPRLLPRSDGPPPPPEGGRGGAAPVPRRHRHRLGALRAAGRRHRVPRVPRAGAGLGHAAVDPARVRRRARHRTRPGARRGQRAPAGAGARRRHPAAQARPVPHRAGQHRRPRAPQPADVHHGQPGVPEGGDPQRGRRVVARRGRARCPPDGGRHRRPPHHGPGVRPARPVHPGPRRPAPGRARRRRGVPPYGGRRRRVGDDADPRGGPHRLRPPRRAPPDARQPGEQRREVLRRRWDGDRLPGAGPRRGRGPGRRRGPRHLPGGPGEPLPRVLPLHQPRGAQPARQRARPGDRRPDRAPPRRSGRGRLQARTGHHVHGAAARSDCVV
ncbi:MAG: hypothetical protein AVDCRST_MAG32-722, partial [uncultured Nocardioides sp.]